MSDSLDISAWASSMHRRGLGAPAIFMLEMYKPLSSVGHAALTFSGPVLSAFFGPKNIESALELLGERDAIERLIVEIENLAQQAAE